MYEDDGKPRKALFLNEIIHHLNRCQTGVPRRALGLLTTTVQRRSLGHLKNPDEVLSEDALQAAVEEVVMVVAESIEMLALGSVRDVLTHHLFTWRSSLLQSKSA